MRIKGIKRFPYKTIGATAATAATAEVAVLAVLTACGVEVAAPKIAALYAVSSPRMVMNTTNPITKNAMM
jgi:hypothetical protein